MYVLYERNTWIYFVISLCIKYLYNCCSRWFFWWINQNSQNMDKLLGRKLKISKESKMFLGQWVCNKSIIMNDNVFWSIILSLPTSLDHSHLIYICCSYEMTRNVANWLQRQNLSFPVLVKMELYTPTPVSQQAQWSEFSWCQMSDISYYGCSGHYL